MKVVYLMLLSSMSLLIPLHAQTLAFWPLTPDFLGEARIFSNDINGLPFKRGNGLDVLNFSSSGVSAANWAEELNDEATVDYFQFGIENIADQTAETTGLRLKERRSSSGPLIFSLTYSKDNFQTETLLTTQTLPDDIAWRDHLFSFNIKIAGQEKLLFRLYAYNSESNSGSFTVNSNTLELLGSVMPACPSPSIPPSIQMVETAEESVDIVINGGSGSGRLVVLTPQEDATAAPYQGEVYLGNTTYGMGDNMANSTHAIISSSDPVTAFTIDGLTPGGAYRLSVFEYITGDMCYASTPLEINFTTPCGNAPQAIREVKRSGLESKIALKWEPPNCFDKYLIVASENEIVGYPAGIDFDDSTAFGEGSPANGFEGEVFPVYYGGNYNAKEITDVTNGTTYYFAAYTRLGNQWSAANRFTAQPQEACQRHYYERIYINEFHYANGVVSQDQGVEIAGPAGMDLSNYELVIHQRVGNGIGFIFEVYRTSLSGYIDDEGSGLGAVWFPIPTMPASRGSIRLLNTVNDEVADFVDYDPAYAIFDILSHPFDLNGPPSPNLLEHDMIPAGLSLQRVGQGSCPVDFQWLRIPHTRGEMNIGQALLPVQITVFGAEAKGKDTRIFWQTAVELNSDYFIVERSKDGRNFAELAKVTAAGYSQQLEDYELYDYSPYDGINYYRLSQVDFDGSSYDHGIVTVKFEGNTQTGPSIFPNPVNDLTTVSWSSPAEVLKLSDTQGRLLLSIPLDADGDSGARSLDMSAFNPGLYFIHLESRDGVESLKLLKR